MEEILHQLIGILSHYLQGFIESYQLKKNSYHPKSTAFFSDASFQLNVTGEALLGESSLVMK